MWWLLCFTWLAITATFGAISVTCTLNTQLLPTGHNSPLWHLDVADALDDDAYSYEYTGKNVNVYIIDSGVDTTHPEFEGRAQIIYNDSSFSPQERTSNDATGHGTHVAALVGGRTYGIAKGANLFALRVFGSTGHTDDGKVLGAIAFLSKTLKKNVPSVINVSLGPPLRNLEQYFLSDNVANKLSELSANFNVPIVIASGNDRAIRCSALTSLTKNAIVVTALDSKHKLAGFANSGDCINFIAPGTNIRSAWPGGQSKSLSGTSQAAPYVTGIIAQYYQLLGPTISVETIIKALSRTRIDIPAPPLHKDDGAKRMFAMPLTPLISGFARARSDGIARRNAREESERSTEIIFYSIIGGGAILLLVTIILLCICCVRGKSKQARAAAAAAASSSNSTRPHNKPSERRSNQRRRSSLSMLEGP